MAGNSNESGRGVTSKATALLDAFLPRSTELSLGELSRRSGIPMSTTYRLANQLVEWGGLQRVDGGYRLGLRLWELGALARTGQAPLDLITPYLQDLYDVVKENVQLAVRDGNEVVYLEKLTARSSVPPRVRTGGRLPVHATAVGKVLLAWSDPEQVEAMLPESLTRYTPSTITDRKVLLTQLEDIRREGIAYSYGELTVGVTAVAAPIRDVEGKVPAALSIAVRSAQVKQHHISALRGVVACASRQLRNLGFPIRMS